MNLSVACITSLSMPTTAPSRKRSIETLFEQRSALTKLRPWRMLKMFRHSNDDYPDMAVVWLLAIHILGWRAYIRFT